MDDDAKEVAKIVAGVALQPAVKLIDNVIGALGGDALADFRERQQRRRRERHEDLSKSAIKLLQHRGVKEPVEPNAAAVDELAEAAQNEPREELRAIWAALLAAMFDPARAPSFRREFIEIAKQLEPIDAVVLPKLAETGGLSPTRKVFIAGQLKRNPDEVANAFRNLEHLGLTAGPHDSSPDMPMLLPLGRQFLRAIESR